MAGQEVPPQQVASGQADVDVIIVSHNGEDEVTALLSSLRSSLDVTCRLLVVDNASRDRTVATALRMGVEVVPCRENVGYGAAFNVGLRSTTSDWVVCSNQDIVVEPSTLRILITAVSAYEAQHFMACIAGPSLRTGHGELLETFHRLPSLWQQLAELLGGETLAGSRSQVPSGTGPQECGWMSAAFILARRSTFEALGGFDPAYFMYGEDVDLFARLHAMGGRGLWVPDATVRHSGGVQVSMSPPLVAHAAWGWSKYFGDRRGWAAKMAVNIAALVGSVLRTAVWGLRAARGVPEADAMFADFIGLTKLQMKTTISRRRPPVPG